MLNALGRAVEVFKDKAAWRAIQENGFKSDFSWPASAKKYMELYKKIERKG
jgi:starch synthase